MRRGPHSNRRKHARLKLHKTAQVSVHLFPVLPFLGISVQADLLNLSAGGIGLRLNRTDLQQEIRKGRKLKIHFRLPGSVLTECRGVITHRLKINETYDYLGLKFSNKPLVLSRMLHQMAFDNEMCDRRIQQTSKPWCDPTCSFMGLCRKPLRLVGTANLISSPAFEIALQSSF